MVMLVSQRHPFFGRLAATPSARGPIAPLVPAPLSQPSRCRGLWGRIARRRAAVFRGEDGLVFQLGRRRWPLDEILLDHRDDDGVVEFRVLRERKEEARARYRRKGPTVWNELGTLNFFDDEPWSWEDSDFGLFAFHIATGTGPVKLRHFLTGDFAIPPDEAELPGQSLVVDDAGVRRRFRGFPGGHEQIGWGALTEIRAKFEITGIWSDPTLLILRGHNEQVVVPIFDGTLDLALRERLVGLPGFDSQSEDALDDALDYARRYGHEDRPISRAELRTRAERLIWMQPRESRGVA